MNNPDTNIKTRRTYIYVSIAFLVLALSLQVLMWLYWNRVLEPRLRLEAEYQANVLAHSQSVKLAEALNEENTEKRSQVITETLDEILLFTDLQTDAQRLVASGIYIYHVDSQYGEFLGRFAVVK